MNKEDLLNLDNTPKNSKKFLIYGAAAFLVFVIGVIVFALVGGNSNKKNTEIIPPQVKEEPMFKELPIEKETPKNITPSENKNKVKKSKVENKEQKPKIEEKPKEIKKVKKEAVKPVIKPTVKVNKKLEHKVSKKYYIQVAAFLKYTHPNKKFLALLKKYGYHYIIYPVTITKNGKKIKINKLLIGPFNKSEAKKELIKVKKYITQNAFIFKVK